MKTMLFLLLALIATTARADTVILREGSSPINCAIVSWSKEGLRITRDETSSQEVLPWYRIREVSAEEIGVGFLPHLERGEMLWRAKLRLLRGDISLSTPLFREVFMELKNHTGLDAYLAAEGLLRCHLANGNLNESVAPWLAVVDHVQSGNTSQLEALASIIDLNTFLCPHLPPVWDSTVVARSLRTLKLRSDVAHAFYAIISSPLEDREYTRAGPVFLNDVVLLLDAKDRVAVHSKDLEMWQKCWLLFAEATGLQKQGEEEKAMLKFAEVVALYETSQPWLAGAAMLALIETFDRAGDTKVVNNIKSEISRVLPNHPLRKD